MRRLRRRWISSRKDIEAGPGGFHRLSEAGSATAAMLSFAEVAEEALRRAGEAIRIPRSYTAGWDIRPSISSFCAQAAEVEIDPETGRVTVTQISTAHDVGTVINPMMHQGQIDGGVVQGLGYALMEELRVEEGAVQNPNLGDYKLPTITDMPKLVTELLEEEAWPLPFEGRAIAELPNVPAAAAIANAVADAIGVRLFSLPITAEKVYQALHPELGEESHADA